MKSVEQTIFSNSFYYWSDELGFGAWLLESTVRSFFLIVAVHVLQMFSVLIGTIGITFAGRVTACKDLT